MIPLPRFARALAVIALACAPIASADVGYDISWPQCDRPYPPAAAFAILGVNGGTPFTPSPCLGAGPRPSQLAWAAASETGFYLNTANPGPTSPNWPNGQPAPRACAPGALSAECSYDYGWNAALDSYGNAVAAFVSLGMLPVGAQRTPVPNRWWLDVERANSWQADPALNVATLQGAADALEALGVAEVGVYASPADWQAITGTTTAFAGYPTWAPIGDRADQAAAEQTCTTAGSPSRDVTGGGIAMVQWVTTIPTIPGERYDANVRCALEVTVQGPATPIAAGRPTPPITARRSYVSRGATTITVTSNAATGRFAPGPSGPWVPGPFALTVGRGVREAAFVYRQRSTGAATLRLDTPSGERRVRVTVESGAVARLERVAPRRAVRVGRVTLLRGRDRFGNALTTRLTAWSVAPQEAGRITKARNGTARLVPRRAGRLTVTVRAGGSSRSLRLTARR